MSDVSSPPRLTVAQCATLSCLLEVIPPKPGNVHRGADFDDMTFLDLAVSAAAIGPILDEAVQKGVGATVLECVESTRRLVRKNTNLGIILLLAPLAAVPRSQPLRTGLPEVLAGLTPHDARDVYQAIRLAQPGGLGESAEADVHGNEPEDLIAAMTLAADRDLVARQYANGFSTVLEEALPLIVEKREADWSLSHAVVWTQLTLLSRYPDTLIARKCGAETAQQASDWAAKVLEQGTPADSQFVQAASDLDFWMRCDGHRRNPGTTADILAAALFAGLREGRIRPPFH